MPCGEPDLTWGSQSWLQPPFEAAPRATTETDLVVAKPRLLSRAKRPPERRLQPGLAAPLKRFVFALLGKDPDAVVVSFWTGSDALVLKMIEEIRQLVPDRQHYVAAIGPGPTP